MHQLLIALLAQNKVGHPALRSFGIPCAARQAGRRPKLALRAQTTPADCPRLGCAARRGTGDFAVASLFYLKCRVPIREVHCTLR